VKLHRSSVAVIATATVVLALSACGPGSSNKKSTAGKGVGSSQSKFDKLVKDAKKEGTLNAIALPNDWANYGNVIKAFESRYGIKVKVANPAGSSQEEVDAVKKLKGTSRAPDVVDVGLTVAEANKNLFAPYKVKTWNDIPDGIKDPSGLFYGDYGGVMSVGYNSNKVPAITSIKDLLKPAYKGKVALNGDPTQSSSAQYGVYMAALANGGTVDDISEGVAFFKQLKKVGNFIPVDATSATEESGQTPVVFDWNYLAVGEVGKIKGWKVFVPSDALVGGYYNQAITETAPHPNAARLWEEFLYSDEGQNLWLNGSVVPARAEAMRTAGTVDQAAFKKLPQITGTVQYPSAAQLNTSAGYLAKHWGEVTGK
jgi:putative spermidine/putrescine transport system substrate-binding protein